MALQLVAIMFIQLNGGWQLGFDLARKKIVAVKRIWT